MVGMVAGQIAAGRSKIVENTVFLAVSGAGGVLLTLVQLGILSRVLAGDLFGLFVALRGFSLLLATIMLVGLPQVLIRFVPSYQSRGLRRRALVLLAASSAIVVALGLVMYAARGPWSRYLPETVRVLMPSDETLRWMTLASIALALRLLLNGGFSGLRAMGLQMTLDLLYLVSLTVIIVSMRAALTVLLLFQAIFVINAAAFLVGLPVLVVMLRRQIGSVSGVDGPRPVMPAVGAYWTGAVLTSLVALAFSDVDRFVMASVLPLSAIGVFHVASRVNNVLKRFLGFPVIASQPEITRIFEEGRFSELGGKIRLFTKVTVIGSLLVVALIAAVGRSLISLLSGAEYAGAYRVLLLLLPTVPIASMIAPLLATMRSLHFIRWAVLCDFVWMASYFGTFFLAARSLGATGMAIAQVGAGCAQMAVAFLLARRERLYGGIGSRTGRVLFALVPVAAAGALVTERLGTWGALLVVVISPVVGRSLLGLLSVFSPAEKEQIMSLLPARAPRRIASWFIAAEGRRT